MSLREVNGGIILSIFVKPNSPEFKIELDGDEVVVYATEEPEKGKVNKEIIKELTRRFHAQVELMSGATSKEKKLFIQGIGKQELEQVLTKV
jgi:Uncharacterized conserved protein